MRAPALEGTKPSKQNRSVGSPHTWPHLLAVLQWMIELLEYDSGVQDQVDDFEQEDSEKFFFGHLVRSYDAFMSGADDELSLIHI